MHQRRHFLPLVVCVLTLLIAMAAGLLRAPTAPAQTRTPIKIGVLAPLTGPLAPPALSPS